MKALFISNLYPPTVVGGYEISCAQVVDRLFARGHDVRVITTIGDQIAPSEPHVIRTMRHPDIFSSDRPRVRSSHWEVESNIIDSGNVLALLRVLREFQPDVCYLWNLIGLGGAALVGTLEYLGVPWVWHLGDAIPAYLPNFGGRVLPLASELTRWMTGSFIAASQGVISEVEHVVGLGGRVRIVPYWVDDRIQNSHDDAVSRQQGSLVRIAFAGRISEEKGVFLLLDALGRLSRSGITNFELNLFGRGDYGRVSRVAAQHGISERVRSHGWLSQAELRQELRRHHIFAFPTWEREPFGIAPLEAAAEGCVPLVATPSGVAEWLVDGVDCLKARRDPDEFAAVIGAVCRGEVDISALGRRARAVVRRDFSLSSVMPQIEEELERARQRRRAATGDDESAYKLVLVAEALVRSAVSIGGLGC